MDARNQDHEYANKLIRLPGIERLTNQDHTENKVLLLIYFALFDNTY